MEAIQEYNLSEEKIQSRHTALALREDLLRSEKTHLPENITIEDIKKGEATVPQSVKEFFQYLISGPDTRVWESSSKKRRVDSITQDVLSSSTSGRKKPRKHLELGINLKSLTGSRKVLEIMNRLGHCASYHTIEELELVN